MCRRVTCRTCGRPTWAGCGQHVEQALAGVPAAERCSCASGGSSSSGSTGSSASGASADGGGRPAGGSLLRRLFGR